MEKDLCICFVEHEKAFDRVDGRKMMWMLKEIGVDWRDRNLIAKLYLGQRAVVRIDGELHHWTRSSTRVSFILTTV